MQNLSVKGYSIIFRASGLLILLTAVINCNNIRIDSASGPDQQIEAAKKSVLNLHNSLVNQDVVSRQDSYSLLMSYCNQYLSRSGEPVPEVESFLLDRIGSRAAGYGFASLVRNEIDIPFTEKLLDKMDAGNESEAILFKHSELLYRLMLIWHQTGKDREDWIDIIALMDAADKLKPTYGYQDALAEAYRSLGMKRELFTHKAYQSFDLGYRENTSLQDLKTLWDEIEGAKLPFENEIADVNEAVMEDILQKSSVTRDFQLNDESFTIGDGKEEYSFRFGDAEKTTSGRSLAVAVFSTDCPYCVEELKILSDLNTLFESDLLIVGLREKNGGSINAFTRRNRIEIPMLVNDESGILNELDISSVPVMFLFDSVGNLKNKIRFRSTANLEEKMFWLLKNAPR